MTQNPTCVKIMRSIFMNKKTISFRVYQANRLEQRAENQYVAGIIIIKSPCIGFPTQIGWCFLLLFLVIFTQTDL